MTHLPNPASKKSLFDSEEEHYDSEQRYDTCIECGYYLGYESRICLNHKDGGCAQKKFNFDFCLNEREFHLVEERNHYQEGRGIINGVTFRIRTGTREDRKAFRDFLRIVLKNPEFVFDKKINH